MLEPLYTFFDKLISDFSWRRLFFLVLILILMGLSLGIYEYFTSHFMLWHMDQTTSLLERLASDELEDNISGDNDLEQVHRKLKSDLNQLVAGSDSSTPAKGTALAMMRHR